METSAEETSAEETVRGVPWRRLGRADSARAATLLAEAHRRNLAVGVALPTGAMDAAAVAAALADGAALLGAGTGADGPLRAMAAVWPDGEIGLIAVADAEAGHGLGDAALAAAEGLAFALGHDRVYLRTASAHPWLAAWYRRRGYVEEAVPGATTACDLRLSRDLAQTWRPSARRRCAWADTGARLAAYHDVEWGIWVEGERDLFERLSLEVFQTGLSWRAVLAKRAALRAGLLGFEPDRLAAADAADEARFLATPGVIRSPRKFWATVHNARSVAALRQEHGSFAAYLRGRPAAAAYEELRPRLRFFGPSVAQSFFESVGLVPAPHAAPCDRATASPPQEGGGRRPEA